MIEIRNITKLFGKTTAIDSVSFDIRQNSVCCLVGPNGSGKSTLIKVILGLISPNKGEIRFRKKDISIGYMPEVSGLPKGYKGTKMMNLIKPLLKGPQDVFDELIDVFEMSSYMGKDVSRFSKGMQKKIGLLIAFTRSPEVVILDEPFEGIDTIDRDKLNSFIYSYVQKDRTIILSSHILHDLDGISNQAVFLKNGKLAVNYNPKKATEYNDTMDDTTSQLIKIENSSGITELENPTITDIYRRLYS